MIAKKPRFQVSEACMGIPTLLLYGEWLEESGFKPDTQVEVFYSPEYIVIAPVKK